MPSGQRVCWPDASGGDPFPFPHGSPPLRRGSFWRDTICAVSGHDHDDRRAAASVADIPAASTVVLILLGLAIGSIALLRLR